MKDNKCILIVENPVKWATFVRRHAHVEPAYAVAHHAIPYYTIRGDNSRFLSEEREAICALSAKPGTMLIRSYDSNGSLCYVPVNEALEMKTLLNGEVKHIQLCVRSFIQSIGGKKISIKSTSEEIVCDDEKTKWESSTNVSKGLIVADAKISQDWRNTQSGRQTTEIIDKIDDIKPDFDKAGKLLDENPWLKVYFADLLEIARSGRASGIVSSSFKWEITQSVISQYINSVDVAVTYSIVKAKVKTRIENESRRYVDKKLSWNYSITFSDKNGGER